MDVLVPFAAREPKTRLADALEPDERSTFARAMLLDVCDAIDGAGEEPTVLSTAPIETETDAETIVDDRPLTEAVNARLAPPTAVVMADLALATPAALERLFESDADVTMAPGLGGGTNALVVRDPAFRVDYHGASIRDHRRIAESIGAETSTIDSFRLAVDVDESDDLAEVLLHADGRAAAWLREEGFELSFDDGRAVVGRGRS